MSEGEKRAIAAASVFAAVCAAALLLTLLVRPGGLSFGILRSAAEAPTHQPTRDEIIASLSVAAGTSTAAENVKREVLDSLSAPATEKQKQLSVEEKMRVLESLQVK